MRVGVLSDTHNLLRPRVLELLEGCDRLLHAGDVGDLEILERLRRIAPVEAPPARDSRSSHSRRSG